MIKLHNYVLFNETHMYNGSEHHSSVISNLKTQRENAGGALRHAGRKGADLDPFPLGPGHSSPVCAPGSSAPLAQTHEELHMGRRAANTKVAAAVAGLTPSRRGQHFTEAEISLLVQEVRQRKAIFCGKGDKPPQPVEVRQAWEQIAEAISSLHGIKRTADQCRKRLNDIKRRERINVFDRKRGRPPKNREKPTKTTLDYCAVLESKKNLEPLDLEFEIHAPIEDDPDYEPIQKKHEVVRPVVRKVIPKVVLPKIVPKMVPKVPTQPTTPPSHSLAPSPSKARSFSAVKQQDEKHPFLELQQSGFDMLRRELSGFRESIVSLDSRMTQIEVLLRPIGHIADSLARIANAVERLTCPPSP